VKVDKTISKMNELNYGEPPEKEDNLRRAIKKTVENHSGVKVINNYDDINFITDEQRL